MISLIRNIMYLLYISHLFTHSHKKRKDSPEIRAIVLIFSFELEIPGVAVQRIYQNSNKWWFLGRIG